MSDSRRLVDKLWSYCNVLRDDCVGVIEYTEQLTYLLFLKMAHERATRRFNPQQIVPAKYSWQRLLDTEGTELEVAYSQILVGLAQQPGTLGTILPQGPEQNPGSSQWSRWWTRARTTPSSIRPAAREAFCWSPTSTSPETPRA